MGGEWLHNAWCVNVWENDWAALWSQQMNPEENGSQFDSNVSNLELFIGIQISF